MPQHESEIAELRNAVAELKESIQELLDTWRAARGMLTIIKWLAGIASGLGVLWAAWHGGPPHG
jgi:hypothetical protein